MPAKVSAEMKEAIRLLDIGICVPYAAEKSGMSPSHLYRYLSRKRKKKEKKKVDKGA